MCYVNNPSILLSILIFIPEIPIANQKPTKELIENLEYIISDVSFHEISSVVDDYMSELDFQSAVQYLQSPQWLKLVEKARNTSQVVAFFKYFNLNGIDFQQILTFLFKILTHGKVLTLRIVHPNLKNCMDEIMETIPFELIETKFLEVYTSSSDFQDFVSIMKSNTTKDVVFAAAKVCDVQRIIKTLEWMNLRMTENLDYLYRGLGWTKEEDE